LYGNEQLQLQARGLLYFVWNM